MSDPDELYRSLIKAAKDGATDEELRTSADTFWAATLGVAVEDSMAKEKAKPEEGEG